MYVGKREEPGNEASYFFNCNAERSFEALSRDGKITVASSVTVFVMTSILFFIIGFLSGHFGQKGRKRAENVSPLQQHEERELELKENVAYVPVHLYP